MHSYHENKITATLLAHPSATAPIAVVVAASDVAIGAALQQHAPDGWQPQAFFSRKLDKAEKKYSAYDRELLSAYAAVQHFRYMLQGRNFTIFTDHLPLTCAFKQSNEKATPRRLRHLDLIGQFTTDVQHISGRDNVVADTLTRLNKINTQVKTVDYSAIAYAQKTDNELKQRLKSETSLQLKLLHMPGVKASKPKSQGKSS